MSGYFGGKEIAEIIYNGKRISEGWCNNQLIYQYTKYYTLTVNPIPSDATVIFTPGTTDYVRSGNSITVPEGTSVLCRVSKTGYNAARRDIRAINANTVITIPLTETTPAGTVIFESSTPGTYAVDIPMTGDYNVWLVGGGSGSSVFYSRSVNGMQRGGGFGGGSGAYIHGNTELEKKSYTVTIGEGGLGNVTGNTGRAGGSSTLNGNIAGGGQAHATNKVGGGGTYTIVSSGLIGTNGNTGKQNAYNAQSTYINSWDTGGASVYKGYGAGGTTTSKRGEYGKNGYVKIVKA